MIPGGLGVTDSIDGLVPYPALGSREYRPEAGGRKATPLHELISAGFPVPLGFVIPPDVYLDETAHRSLEMAVAAVGGFPVAARSSGHLEDLPGASFAGQYVTRLEIGSTRDLLQAIAECRDSAKSPQVTAYLRKNRLDERLARVSVLIQPMVDAAVAGVAFSVHPTTGREDHALLECCRGLGEKLVSGRTAPTRYVVQLAQASIVERQPGDEDVHLDGRLLQELRNHVLELQAHFGTPQDIEWAVDQHGKIWILQSRPVTRIQWRSDIEEFTTADFREGGVSARVCTPLMYSLYRDAMQRSMPEYFVDIGLLSKTAPPQTWIEMFYGRPYWSASAVKRTLAKVPGYDEEVFDKDLGIQKNYGSAGPVRVPTTLRTLLPAIPVAIKLQLNYHRHLRLTKAYGDRFQSQEMAYLRAAASFEQTDDATFFKVLEQVLAFQLATECDYFTTIYNNANLQGDLKKLLNRISHATGEPVSAIELMSGLKDVSHMRMQRGLVLLVNTAKRDGLDSKAWDSQLRAFLSDNYFHGDVELDISTPRWGEQPERVTQIVADIVRSGSDPKDPELSAQSKFEHFSAEQQRIRQALHRSLWLRLRFDRTFDKQLRLARTYLSRREEMREYSTRAYNLVRTYVIEFGARLVPMGYLADRDDVFMLHIEELLDCGYARMNPASLQAVIRFRRQMYRGYRLLEPPGELGRHISRQSAGPGDRASSESIVLSGIGCSAGIVRGPVRVVAELAQANTLKTGEILVTRFTDPGWTPVLGLVCGVVTEVGGLLSHAAVIGREYGIPAVLNVAGATQILKTGQQVEIDGTAGTVKVVSG